MNGSVFGHVIDIAMNCHPAIFRYSVRLDGCHGNCSLEIIMLRLAPLQVNVILGEKEIGTHRSRSECQHAQDKGNQSRVYCCWSVLLFLIILQIFLKDWITHTLGRKRRRWWRKLLFVVRHDVLLQYERASCCLISAIS